MQDIHLIQVPRVSLKYHNPIAPQDRPRVTSSSDADRIFRAHWSDQLEICEEFYVLLMNQSSECIGIMHHSKGGICYTNVDARLLFAAVVTSLATGIILAHNHPSGNARPSNGDIDFTGKIQQIADLFQIKLFDHLVLTSYGYFSFADEGMINQFANKSEISEPCRP